MIILASGPAAGGTWSAADLMNVGRTGHSSTLLENGKVLVSDGFNYEEQFYFDDFIGEWVFTTVRVTSTITELYDPATDQWTVVSGINPATHGIAVRLSDGKVLAAGGFGSSGLYDPVANSWTSADPLLQSRENHTTTLLQDGRVLVAGGSYLATAEIYDPSTGDWTATGSMTVPRQRHTATRLLDGRVLVTGGWHYDGTQTNYNSCELYDPTDGSWSATGSLSFERVYHAAAILHDGRVLVAGSVATPEIYDPIAGTWSSIPAPQVYRGQPRLTVLQSGKVLVTGGSKSSAEIYDPATNSWSSAGEIGGSLSEHSAILLSDGRALVSGGGSNFSAGTGMPPIPSSHESFLYSEDAGPLTPFEAAAAAAGLADDNALADATPFNDGVPNLLKFAFGLNLGGPDTRRMTPGGTAGLPTAYLHEDGGTFFRVEYLRRKNSGLSYTPRKSTTLASDSFSVLTGTPVVSDIIGFPDWERVTVDEPYDPITTTKLFTVVEVTLD